jgi:hypothetical protein
VPVCLKLDFFGAVRGASPRSPHRHTAAAERDFAALMPVSHRATIGEVASLRAHDVLDLSLHQLVQHPDPDAAAQREQPSSAAPASSLSASCTRSGNVAVVASLTRAIHSPWRLVLLSSDIDSRPPRSQRPDEAGGPPPTKFCELRGNVNESVCEGIPQVRGQFDGHTDLARRVGAFILML